MVVSFVAIIMFNNLNLVVPVALVSTCMEVTCVLIALNGSFDFVALLPKS
jgi:hypothetical protein